MTHIAAMAALKLLHRNVLAQHLLADDKDIPHLTIYNKRERTCDELVDTMMSMKNHSDLLTFRAFYMLVGCPKAVALWDSDLLTAHAHGDNRLKNKLYLVQRVMTDDPLVPIVFINHLEIDMGPLFTDVTDNKPNTVSNLVESSPYNLIYFSENKFQTTNTGYRVEVEKDRDLLHVSDELLTKHKGQWQTIIHMHYPTLLVYPSKNNPDVYVCMWLDYVDGHALSNGGSEYLFKKKDFFQVQALENLPESIRDEIGSKPKSFTSICTTVYKDLMGADKLIK